MLIHFFSFFLWEGLLLRQKGGFRACSPGLTKVTGSEVLGSEVLTGSLALNIESGILVSL